MGLAPLSVAATKPRDFLVLTFDQFILLHRTALAYPHGYESRDPEMGALLDHKLVSEAPTKKHKYLLTPKGADHIIPARLRWPEKVPLS